MEVTSINCEFCNLTFKNKYNLKNHIISNKACLKSRGLHLESKHICKGCQLTFTNNTNLSNHLDICTKYIVMNIIDKNNQIIKEKDEKHQKELKEQQAYYEKELKEQRKEQELYYTEKLRKQDLEYKEKLKETQAYYKEELRTLETNYKEELRTLETNYKEELIKIETKYEDLQTYYNEAKEDFKLSKNKYESTLERIATDAVNRPVSTTNTTNNTVNNIRNVLSSTYTLEKLDEKELIEDMRQNYTENQFKKGQKGLAEYLYKNTLKTPDDKLMICCSDKSRKKFKILDSNGNLKEDSEARFLCEKIKVPVKMVSKEMFDKMESTITKQKENIDIYGSEHSKLSNDMEKLGCNFIDIYHFDENESNSEFINELGTLLHRNNT